MRRKMSLGAVQSATWRRREERMRQIVAAWEEKCPAGPASATVSSQGHVTVPPVVKGDDWQPTIQALRRKVVAKGDEGVHEVENGRACGLFEFCREKGKELDMFWIVDLGCVAALYRRFVEDLPRVRPFFAVKCFPDVRVIRQLEDLGAGFDCASAKEVDLVSKGVDVICANPCKRNVDIERMRARGIKYTTFDCVDELGKLDGLWPVLRIRADDPESRLPFGAKYGATVDEIPLLFAEADRLGIDIKGISFHVGSGARTADAYRNAIEMARKHFRPETMDLLDLGGGFCGDFDESGRARISAAGDTTLAKVINQSLDDFFPQSSFPRLKVIAEPGRYFAESVASLCARVVGHRTRGHQRDVWIADGVYGAFNAIIYDAWLPHAVLVEKYPRDDQEEKADAFKTTTVFGPTCDSLDMVFHNVQGAPHIKRDDMLLFPNCGAYTAAGATDFNGIPSTKAPRFYLKSKSMKLTSEDAKLNLIYSGKPPMELVRYFD